MAGFSEVIFFIISFYASVKFFRIYAIDKRLFNFFLGTSAAFLSLTGLSTLFAVLFPVLDPEFVREWSAVISVSFLLSGVAALLREFRPVFSRFPKAFSLAPLVLILVFPLIIDTVVVKQWALALYQGSTLLIGLLIYSYKSKDHSEYAYIIVGVLYFTATFVLYWLPENYFSLPDYVWMILTGFGILVVTIGYNQVYNLEGQRLADKYRRDTWFI